VTIIEHLLLDRFKLEDIVSVGGKHSICELDGLLAPALVSIGHNSLYSNDYWKVIVQVVDQL
jgi:hypothetical protein